jgi:hypothetical protein
MNIEVTPIPFTPEGPQPLVREIAPGNTYPVDTLGPLRPAVEAVQGMTQAPVAIPAQSALAVASLAVQSFADVETLGGPRPLSLYALTIARSGERKSACDAPFMTEPTFEGLTKLFAHGQPSLGLFSDEGGQFLGGHAMNSENRQKTLAALNDLWQGNPIRRTRSGDGHVTLYGRRLAVHLMVQPIVAQGFMVDPLAAGTGFLSRFLICEPPSAIGYRMQANAKPDDVALVRFEERLRYILETPLPMDLETRELQPCNLALSNNARARLVDFADAIEAAQAPGGDLVHITGAASKAAEQAARIAGVLSLWRDLNASQVEAGDMEDAIELAQFYLSETSRLSSATTVSAEIDRAEALRQWLLGDWPHPEIMARDVVRLGPNPLRESPKARAALGVLEKHGWLVPLDTGTVVRGAARKKAWAIVKPVGNVV